MKYNHNQKGMPLEVLKEVQALCAGYYRRKCLAAVRIAQSPENEQTPEAQAFLRYNQQIDSAIEFIEEGIREYILHDIALGTGYWASMAAPFITKNAYYARKNKALCNLAKELNLVIS